MARAASKSPPANPPAASAASPRPDPGVSRPDGTSADPSLALLSNKGLGDSAINDFLNVPDAPGPEDDDADDDGEGETPDGDGDADEADPEEEESEEGEDDTEEAETPAAGKPGRPPAVEKVRVTDDKGTREIEVDFSGSPESRAKLRRYVEQAHGAMKVHARWKKAEAAAAKAASELAERKEEIADTAEIRRAAEEEGVDAVLKKLTDKTLDEHIAYRQKRAAFLADPKIGMDKKQEFLEKEAKEKADAATKRAQAKIDRERGGIQADKDAAYKAQLASITRPAFNKVRFAGKLGNPTREHKLDSMLWAEMQTQLDAAIASGVESVTPEFIASVLRDARDTLGAVIETEAMSLADRRAKDKKTKAKQAAAAAARGSSKSLAAQAAAPKEPDWSDPNAVGAWMASQARTKKRK